MNVYFPQGKFHERTKQIQGRIEIITLNFSSTTISVALFTTPKHWYIFLQYEVIFGLVGVKKLHVEC